MKKEAWLFVGVALIVGILVGVLVGNRGSRSGGAGQGQGQAPPSAAPAVNVQQNITMLEGIVAKDPANRNAWVQLGNTYFDSDNPMKAVEAYGKALELDGNDPNVLTDQGVMFRRLGWYDRAVDNFTKAYDLDPAHAQSLYNLGVVYRYDLQDLAKAKEAWEKYLKVNPSGPGADQVRQELNFIKAHPQMPAAAPQPGQ